MADNDWSAETNGMSSQYYPNVGLTQTEMFEARIDKEQVFEWFTYQLYCTKNRKRQGVVTTDKPTHSLTQAFTYSLSHSLTHSLDHSI